MVAILPTLLLVFAWGIGLSYAALQLFYRQTWKQIPDAVPPISPPKTRISVLIAARNEALNIVACLQSILACDYPPHLLEVWVADDHSEDTTAFLARSLNDKRIRVLQMADFPPPPDGIAFKKNAIAIALRHSSGELIVTTDADCRVAEQWLSLLADAYENRDLHFIAAPVQFEDEGSIFGRFQMLEFIGLMGITASGIQTRFHYLSNGANLAYSRTAFEYSGGYHDTPHRASGDDMFLLQKIITFYPRQALFLKHPQAKVYTRAQPSLRAFIRQRIRWGTKNSLFPQLGLQLALGIGFLFSWVLIASGVAGFFIPQFWWFAFAPLLLLKLSMDYLLLAPLAHWFGKPKLLRSTTFLPAQGLHILYMAIVGLLSLFIKHYEWKGRRTR